MNAWKTSSKISTRNWWRRRKDIKKQLVQNKTYFDGLLTKALSKVKNDYDQKLKEEMEDSNRKFLEEHWVQQALIALLNDGVA